MRSCLARAALTPRFRRALNAGNLTLSRGAAAGALSIYAQAMRRDEGENRRLEALVNGTEWAREGGLARSERPAEAITSK